jgi:Cd2+/Zn2+-exporting ATPase
MQVAFDPHTTNLQAIHARVADLGYQLELQPAALPGAPAVAPPSLPGWLWQPWRFVRFLWQNPTTRPTFIGALVLAISLVLNWLQVTPPISTIGYLSSLTIAGLPLAFQSLRSLFFTRQISISLLMTIAAVGAILIGEPAEGAAVVILFAIGEALEAFTMQHARDSLNSLMQLAPAEATVLTPHPVRRAARDVAIGETILVQPSERIALDGLITHGESQVSQQHITGESLPILRRAGDSVYAGSINGDGALEIRVTHAADQSLLSRIATLVAQAQSERAPFERFIDRFAAVYTPAIVLVAILVAAIPPLLFGQPFFDQAGQHGWLYRALSLLVIACPCALVISTPVTVVSALSAASRAGVLVRGGAALEALRQVRVIAFDKTGTLTHGQPDVIATHCSNHVASSEHCTNCDDLLALAAAVETRSNHPLAGAVVRAAEQRQLTQRYAAEQVTALPGRGVQGVVAGQTITIGSHAYFDAEHRHGPEICQAVTQAESQGQTVMLVCACDQGGVQGFISLADTLRPESASTIAALRQAGIVRLAMLTGDHMVVAQQIAAATGLDEVRSGLLPAEKLAAIHDLQQRYGAVAMVGDGANDTPALAAATVGIAMGAAGSDQALATADVALMQDDLTRLPFLIRLSQQAATTIRWNIAISLVTKVLFLILALAGVSSLWLAVAADSGIALLVTLNGMRLLRTQP